MSIQTNSPDSNLAASLSADEIVAAGGALSTLAPGTAYKLTTGTGSAYVLAPDVPVAATPANGYKLAVRFHTASLINATIAVSGNPAVSLTKPYGVPLSGGELPSGLRAIISYNSSLGSWDLLSPYKLAGNDLPTSPYMMATKTAQILGSGSEVKLTYDSPSVNTAGFTESSDVFTATLAGWHFVQVAMYVNGTAISYVVAKKNGSEALISPVVRLDYYPTLRGLVYLDVGDTVEIHGYSSAGGNINSTYPFVTNLCLIRIGA